MNLTHIKLISMETSVKNNRLEVKFDKNFTSLHDFSINKFNWNSSNVNNLAFNLDEDGNIVG